MRSSMRRFEFLSTKHTKAPRIARASFRKKNARIGTRMIGRVAPSPLNRWEPACCKTGPTLDCRFVAILLSTGITCARIGSDQARQSARETDGLACQGGYQLETDQNQQPYQNAINDGQS